MAKKEVHIWMNEPIAAAVQQYADRHGISFTAALAVLAARGLRDEGIIPAAQEGR